eukprot:COSAG01_NODE_3125_length_6546_cov_6.634869_3_plen_77_part_00
MGAAASAIIMPEVVPGDFHKVNSGTDGLNRPIHAHCDGPQSRAEGRRARPCTIMKFQQQQQQESAEMNIVLICSRI